MKVVYTLVPTKVPNAKMCTKLISCELQAELERATAKTARTKWTLKERLRHVEHSAEKTSQGNGQPAALPATILNLHTH